METLITCFINKPFDCDVEKSSGIFRKGIQYVVISGFRHMTIMEKPPEYTLGPGNYVLWNAYKFGDKMITTVMVENVNEIICTILDGVD